MIKLADLEPGEAVFHHFDDVTHVQTTYAVNRMVKWCQESRHETVLVPVDYGFAVYVIRNRGIEGHRLGRLAELPVESWEPLVFCVQPDGTYLIVDGSHRYVQAATQAMSHVRAYTLNREEWLPFVVEDFPQLDEEKLLTGKSGL